MNEGSVNKTADCDLTSVSVVEFTEYPKQCKQYLIKLHEERPGLQCVGWLPNCPRGPHIIYSIMGRNTPKCHILACSNTHFFNFNLSLFFFKYQGSDEASDCSHFNTEVPVLQSTVVQAQIMSSTCLATRSLEVTGTEGSSGNSHRLDGVNLVKSKSSSPSTANAL